MEPQCHQCNRPLDGADAICLFCSLSSALDSDTDEPAEDRIEVTEATPRSGTTVGVYEVGQLIGRGGMGEVYRGTHERLGRQVALKFLPPDYYDHPSRRARLVHEAKTSSALNHPNIVTIHDLIEHDGQDVLVMECIEGDTLGDRLVAGALTVETALKIGIQIVDALSAAHAAGIVHRDLKPSNVMLIEGDRVKLVDFGLAKEVAVEGIDTETRTLQQLTVAGSVVGTAAYMSPEQARGESVGPASDIFSFGVLLYEMLAGHRPFNHTDRVELLHQICNADPPMFESKGTPAVAEAIDDLLRHLLQKSPAERPSSIAEVRPTLRQILLDLGASTGGRPTVLSLSMATAPAVSSQESAGGRRWWIPAGVVAGLLLLLGIAWIATRDQASTRQDGAVLASTPFDDYRQGRQFLDRYYLEGYLERAVRHLESAVAQAPDNGSYYAALAEAYWRRFEVSQDPIWLQRASAHAERALTLDPSSQRGHIISGHLQLERSELANAERTFERALQLAPGSAEAHRGLARVRQRQQRFDDAEREYRSAINLAPEEAAISGGFGVFLYSQSRFEEAAATFERSVRMDPDYLPSQRNLAASYHMLGRFADAASALQRAIEIRADPISYSNLGTLYFFQGMIPQAIDAFDKATELSPNSWEYWAFLGDAYRWSADRRADAQSAYDTALQIFEERPERLEGPPERSRYALLLTKQGNHEAARRELRAVESEEGLGSATLYRVALAHELLGERDAALAALGSAVRAGYSRDEIRQDPELTELRADRRYRQIVATN